LFDETSHSYQIGAVPPVDVAVHVMGVSATCGDAVSALSVTLRTGPSTMTNRSALLASPLLFELPTLRTATPT